MASLAPQRLELSAHPSSVREARTFVKRVLVSWGLTDPVDVVALLVSELATNAVLHARTAFVVVVSADREDVTVEVHDGSDIPPRRRQNSTSATNGRGMALVDRLAGSWGSRPAPNGFAKVVWFTVPVAGAPDTAWDLVDDL